MISFSRLSNLRVLFLATAIAGLSACGGSTADKIVDQIDTKYSADINFINASNEMMSFYVKSTVYNKSVFDGDFKLTELEAESASSSFRHEWIDGAHETLFGTRQSVSEDSGATFKTELSNGKDYWAISWLLEDESKVEVIEKSNKSNANAYNVRVFANAELNIMLNGEQITETEIGTVTSYLNVENCTDLFVGGNEIDLCQEGVLGESYLAIVDENGLLVLVKE